MRCGATPLAAVKRPLMHSSTHLISPFLLYAILFCTYGILLNPFRYFTNMSDILQKENVCFTHII